MKSLILKYGTVSFVCLLFLGGTFLPSAADPTPPTSYLGTDWGRHPNHSDIIDEANDNADIKNWTHVFKYCSGKNSKLVIDGKVVKEKPIYIKLYRRLKRKIKSFLNIK